MRLCSIEYQEWPGQPQSWQIEHLDIFPRMLIVGRNASGKTRVLNVISSLSRVLSGIQPPVLSGNYCVTFDNNGEKYVYEVNQENGLVARELLTINGKEYLAREKDGSGEIFANQIGDEGMKIRFQVLPNAFAAFARVDAIQHPFLKPLNDWANSLRHYSFSTVMQSAFAVSIPIGVRPDDRDQNATVALYRTASGEFGNEFIDMMRSDLGLVDYAIESIELDAPKMFRFPSGTEPVALVAHEEGLTASVDQLSMSTGMFRVVAILTHINYAILRKAATSILIDDIGEGLDFDRSCRLIDLLREKAKKHDIQLIMTSNDKFVMNNVPLEEWTILHRVKQIVYPKNHINSTEAFEEFGFTGLSNFSFFELNSKEMVIESKSEDDNA